MGCLVKPSGALRIVLVASDAEGVRLVLTRKKNAYCADSGPAVKWRSSLKASNWGIASAEPIPAYCIWKYN